MDSVNLLKPLELSYTANELEKSMQQAFIKTYIELLGEDIADVFDYCAPHMAGMGVIERFTKQDGLVVLRRPETSETLMRIIYATWVSMGSKRGLSFLDFVLRMLWPGQYKIKRIYHSKALANQYPSRLTYSDSEENFLTSRIHVSMDMGIDMDEMAELAPTLSRLVPANIVPSVAIELPVNDIKINSAIGFQTMFIGNFEPDFM